MPSEGFCRARRKTRGLAAPLAALAPPNPALSVTALAVTGRAGVHLAAASALPGAGFASRGIVKRRPLGTPELPSSAGSWAHPNHGPLRTLPTGHCCCLDQARRFR